MTATIRPLADLIDGYGHDGPQNGAELLTTDPDELTEIQRELRRHFTLAVQSSQQLPFGTPADVARRLELGHVLPRSRQWVTLALDEKRHRIMRPSKFGGLAAMRFVSKKVPDPDLVHKYCPLPDGGTYLLIYGGGPTILGVEDRRGGGVAADISRLSAALPVADVVFWLLEKGEPAAFYSLAVELGEKNREPIPFPDPHWVRLAKHQWGVATTAPT